MRFTAPGPYEPPTTEASAYAPRSPYAASKAGADFLARSYFHTYGLPVLITNCTNNYGPYQFPEKLIPFCLSQALEGKPIPIYGRGDNIRDWLFVEDHCRAWLLVLEQGVPGDTYNIAGEQEKPNLELVRLLLRVLSELRPELGDLERLITLLPIAPVMIGAMPWTPGKSRPNWVGAPRPPWRRVSGIR